MGLTVAIVGRPNVGKSTLFNRLVGRRVALVDKEPGVTRDWREGDASLGLLEFRLIDTAGLEEAEPGTLRDRMGLQTQAALEHADIALMLIDARAGVTPADRHFANLLRKGMSPVVLIANKCEGGGGEAGVLEGYSLGLGDPVAISAEHGQGLDGLYDVLDARDAALKAVADAEPGEDAEEGILRLAIVGRPNVGKSTLVNRLLGSDRMLTGPESGITRDAIPVEWAVGGRRIRLIDTAGLRRKAKVTGGLERLSVASSLRAVRLADVVVVMIDGQAPLEKQDLSIARMAVEEGRALVVALNKWDAVRDRRRALAAVTGRMEKSLAQIRGVPVVPLSALTGAGVAELMPAVLHVYDVWARRIPTAVLNRWLAGVAERHPPPLVDGHRIRLRYLTQAAARPPSFVLFASRIRGLPESYVRYLVNGLRETFVLAGTPIRLQLRSSGRARP